MRLSDFDYHLPKKLIAQRPLKKRDSCRLLVIDRKAGTIRHRRFKDLKEYLCAGDTIVLNDTKVMPVRFIAEKETGGKVDVLLIKKRGRDSYDCMLKANRPVKPGTKLEFITDGLMPLPPYIKRMPDKRDFKDYQTVYAKKEGAIASPTAGLHFTKAFLNGLTRKKVRVEKITLHVGLGTFEPVKTERIEDHKMHSEWFSVNKKTADALNKTKSTGSKVFAIGTTTCRSLEASSFSRDTRYEIRDTKANTDLFIYPGYKFKFVDCLLTNFHLPKTTLLILVSAFCGKKLLFEAYRQAVKRKYRFYSYGDAMLIA